MHYLGSSSDIQIGDYVKVVAFGDNRVFVVSELYPEINRIKLVDRKTRVAEGFLYKPWNLTLV